MHIEGVEAMDECARELLSRISPRADGAATITLSGDLGAGKTTFAQGIARALGVRETVASPTFVIEKVYELTASESETSFCDPNDRRKRKKMFPIRWTHLIHIDAYRLKDAHELEVLGWREMAQDPGNLIVIEWPEMVAELIPKDAAHVFLRGDGDSRDISVEIQ